MTVVAVAAAIAIANAELRTTGLCSAFSLPAFTISLLIAAFALLGSAFTLRSAFAALLRTALSALLGSTFPALLRATLTTLLSALALLTFRLLTFALLTAFALLITAFAALLAAAERVCYSCTGGPGRSSRCR